MEIIKLTPDNLEKESLFCSKDPKTEGFQKKALWFKKRQQEGLQIHIAKDDGGKAVGFIEFIPGEYAWRPVSANEFMFIHCIMVYPNKARNSGVAGALIKTCKEQAANQNLKGMAVMTSKGSWLADKRLFEKNNFKQIDKSGRFELMVQYFDDATPPPSFLNWNEHISQYTGWNLLYADQCPWHDKAVLALQSTARENGITLNITEVESAIKAQQVPSGFGVFALIKDGKLLEDHYISETRFKNILKKELA